MDDFFEEDEPLDDIVRAFDEGEKGLTARPVAGRTESLVIPLYGGAIGVDLHFTATRAGSHKFTWRQR